MSVGESGTGRAGSQEYYKETFFPSVTDAAKATVIEVTEGSETTSVDIVMGRPVGTFKVAGRVVDGDTGKPIPNVNYGVGQRISDESGGMSFSSSSSSSVDRTNANGEFGLENVKPGKYTIYTDVPEGSDMPSASVTFDIVDRDVTNLVITMRKGGSLSGVVAVENQAVGATPGGLKICASVQGKDSDFTNSAQSTIGQDGSFRINGVRSGRASFWLCGGRDEREQFHIVRVERNGVAQADNFNVGKSEHVTGLRVLVKHVKLTGVIRGQVKVESGELPPISQLELNLWPLDENLQPQRQSSISSPKLDARGYFLSEGLPAGAYRLTVSVVSRAGNRATHTTQQVIVNDDAVTEVTVIIKPDPK